MLISLIDNTILNMLRNFIEGLQEPDKDICSGIITGLG